MSKVFKNNKFTNVSNILPKVVQKLGLDKRLNEQALFYLWPSILDEVYAKRSIPLYIDSQNILLVAVEDSSTAQELSFIKPKLMKKLKVVAGQLDLKIEGIRFDIKQFHSATKEVFERTDITKIDVADIAESDLLSLKLNQAEIAEIEQFKDDIKNAIDVKPSDEAKLELFSQRLISLVEKQIRVKNWHKRQNLPFCKQCNEAMFQTGVLLCHYCLQQKQSGSRNDDKYE